jgi:hypothetical protein
MYLYLSPQGGFNDILCVISFAIDYCIAKKRTLLVDTTNGCYDINFSQYFYFKNISIPIITDVDDIRKIIANNSLTIYPKIIKDRNINNWNFIWTPSSIYTLNKITLDLPIECNYDIIVYSICGGGSTGATGGPGIKLFKYIFFKKSIVDHIKCEFAKLPTRYLAIHIRNTDITCDYVSLYNSNTELIRSYKTVYIATDDPKTLVFFRYKGINILNFTKFPDNYTRNLHYSTIPSDTKIKNMLCDLYFMCMADNLLSNSPGGFIKLVRDIRSDISIITNKVI